MKEILVFSALVSSPAPDFTGIPHEEPTPQVASYSAMPVSRPHSGYSVSPVEFNQSAVYPMQTVLFPPTYGNGLVYYPTPGVVGQSPFYGSNFPVIGTPTHTEIVGQQYPIHNLQAQGQHLTTYAPIAEIPYSAGQGISGGGIVPPQHIVRLPDGCLTGA